MKTVVIIWLMLFNAGFCVGQPVNKKKPRLQDVVMLAWNEDTANSHQFALTRDNLFFYTISSSKGGKRHDRFYKGIYQHSADTIYLNYDEDLHPAGQEDYMILETSGNYLIQPLVNGKRLFLRFQRRGHLLWNQLR